MPTPLTITYEVADVHCMLCGRQAGIARRESSAGPLKFRQLEASDWTPVRSVSQLRCAHCAGGLWLNEFELRRDYNTEAIQEEESSRPRRGRPPRPFRVVRAA